IPAVQQDELMVASDQSGKNLSVVAEVDVVGIGEPYALRRPPVESDHRIGILYRQRAKIDVKQREDGRIDANAKRKSQRRHGGESGRLDQYPRAVAHILQKRPHETSSFNVASQVLDEPQITEAPLRLSLRFIRLHPALDVLPRPHQQVKAHLILHLLLDPVLAQQSI